MKLYGSLTSPYVRKIRVLLAEKSLDCEFVAVDAAAADSPVPQHNPLGLVPTLVRDDGSPLFDSPVIAEYLDSRKSPLLIPASGETRWEVLRWAALGDGVLDQTVARTMELRRPAAQQSPDANARREQKVARALAYAEARVSDTYLCEARLTFADIALVCALEYIDLRYAHDWRGKHPKLATWHAGFASRPSFVSTRPPK